MVRRDRISILDSIPHEDQNRLKFEMVRVGFKIYVGKESMNIARRGSSHKELTLVSDGYRHGLRHDQVAGALFSQWREFWRGAGRNTSRSGVSFGVGQAATQVVRGTALDAGASSGTNKVAPTPICHLVMFRSTFFWSRIQNAILSSQRFSLSFLE
ncbi:hypothetical protein OSB04_022100 [Centaurea solstitialis]|uniref:Uncharacterized protein n=1 Tax=Centaurea solstitialis TaxID=347529 RepID=A0AA38W7C0_9ASTR|nr:hypothetical protein OSB04_022100 [Centaurea solstitialis]